MKISKTSKRAIEKAMRITNSMFDNNIEFLRFDQVNEKGTIFQVRLKVKDCNGDGVLFSPRMRRKDGSPRRTASACWHVHGVFHDALNEEAVIYSYGQKKSPGDEWKDINKGSHYFPKMMSECCDCSY